MATADLYGGSASGFSAPPEPNSAAANRTFKQQHSSSTLEKNTSSDNENVASSPIEAKSENVSANSSIDMSGGGGVTSTQSPTTRQSTMLGSLPHASGSVSSQSSKTGGTAVPSSSSTLSAQPQQPQKFSSSKSGGGGGGPDRTKSQEKETPIRSRSSSCSSQEAYPSDIIKCLSFLDTHLTKKHENFSGPVLWVGTSQGTVLALSLRIPFEARLEELATALPTGIHLNVESGSILRMAFMDQCGDMLLPPIEPWKDSTKGRGEKTMKNRVLSRSKPCQASPTNSTGPASAGFGNDSNTAQAQQSAAMTSSTSNLIGEQANSVQFLAILAEKSIKIFSLHSLNKVFTAQCQQDHPLTTADVIHVDSSPVVAGLTKTGRILVYSLPSLKVLMDALVLPPNDLRINRTIQFSQRGHGLYMCSPSEIEKFTIAYEVANQVQQSLPDLFQAVNMPEPPKQNFLKEFFVGSSSKSLDREELFGESSGKTSKSIAQHIPGSANLDHLRAHSGGAVSEIAKARLALNERGEKLGEVEERTAQMMENSRTYSDHASELLNKYKKKKWYKL